jgi:hypothetical protein
MACAVPAAAMPRPWNAGSTDQHLEHPGGAGIAEPPKPEMALGDLLRTLRTAQVRHHYRIAEQTLE